jgi:hypothetical protein
MNAVAKSLGSQARGTGLGARGKSRVFDRRSSPRASSHLRLARKLAIAAEVCMNSPGLDGLLLNRCRNRLKGNGGTQLPFDKQQPDD